MPEIPEGEITARRLDRSLAGVEIESALAPGMVTMKTVDPPLSVVEGRSIEGDPVRFLLDEPYGHLTRAAPLRYGAIADARRNRHGDQLARRQ